MKPIVHSRIHAKKYGGIPEDYLPIDDFMDSTKMCVPDVRHRMILHNAFGIFLAEKVFGHTIVNSENKTVSVRDIAEDHVIQDLGHIPTLEKCLSSMKLETWMGGKVSKYAEQSKPQPVEIRTPTTGDPLPSLPSSVSGNIVTDISLMPRNYYDGQGAQIADEEMNKIMQQTVKD